MLSWITILSLVTLMRGPSLTDAISVRIHVHPSNTSFDPGDNLTLTCLVEHNGRADVIFWYKDDQLISAHNHSNSSQFAEISLVDITRDDAGEYKCMAWNNKAKDTDFIDLHVNAAPKITHLSDEVEVLKNEDKEITCEADGWPPPLIRWKRNGVYIKDGDDYSVRVLPKQNKATLMLRSFSDDHEGEYTCEASNAFGKAEQTVYAILIDQAPALTRSPQIMVDSHYMIAIKGSNVTLECKVLYIIWYIAYSWWKFNGNSTILDKQGASPHYSQSKVLFSDRMTMLLDIINVSERHAGFYECSVLNTKGNDKNNITLMVVGEKGHVQNISTNWETVHAAENTQVQLKCIASYTPFLEVETLWMFQGVVLNETGSRYKTGTYQLNSTDLTRTEEMSLWINNISDPDFGPYTCVVNTSLGMSSAAIFVVQKDFSSEGTDENSMVLLVLFPVLAGGLLLALTALVFIRKLRKKRHQWKLEETPSDGDMKYDVFVTFSNKDSQWVTNNLIPLLERNSLKYCIHSRDFELGRALVDNMAESVYSSRKVLAVMSKNYMDSKFCRGELEMAWHRSRVAHEGSLLVVRIDGIKKKKMPKALREQTFVDYQSDKERNNWEKKLLRFLIDTEVNQTRYVTKL